MTLWKGPTSMAFGRCVWVSATSPLTHARIGHAPAHTHSRTHSLTLALIHSLIPSLTHQLALSVTRLLTLTLAHSLTHALPPLLTHSSTHSHTHSCTHSHSLTRLGTLTLAHSLTHVLAHAFTHPPLAHPLFHPLSLSCSSRRLSESTLQEAQETLPGHGRFVLAPVPKNDAILIFSVCATTEIPPPEYIRCFRRSPA